MALSPNEARRPTHLDIDEADRLEKNIDAAIAGKLEGSQISVSVSYIKRDAVKRILKERYLAKGWKAVDITNHSYQRDGDWAQVILTC